MATNKYFNHFPKNVTQEQILLEDLISETIQIYGHDIYYLPRQVYDSVDHIFGESINSYFSKAYQLEMYIANVEGYEGDGDFFSKFGLEIRDTSNFVVSRRTFERYVPSVVCDRPLEGDLIWVPVLNKIFEIKFVEEELLFFSLGKRNPYMYELRCELFRYSQEDINTGVDEIDSIEADMSYTQQIVFSTGSGSYYTDEAVYQGSNLAYATASANVKSWETSTKTMQAVNIMGVFEANTVVIGVTSNTRYTVASTDTQSRTENTGGYNIVDNGYMQEEANTFVVTTESNFFGSI